MGLLGRRSRLIGWPVPAGGLAVAAILFAAAGCSGGAMDAGPTWARDVAPILHRHCAGCHRPGSTAPFALLSYDDARQRARTIARAVERGVMPPFLPDRSYVDFRDARGLAPSEIDTLVGWARAGAPAGDLDRAPSPPVFADGFELGEPDAIAEMPVAFALPSEGPDLYRNFVVALEVAPGTKIRALELDPGNRAVVHHAAILADASGAARRLDDRDAEPGYDEMVGGSAPGGHFAGWTPGRGANVFEPGMPWVVEEGTDIVLQLHLMPSGRPESVRAKVGLWFTDDPVVRAPVMVHLLATTLDIPAGAAAYAAADAIELPVAVDAFSVYPHAHFLGRKLRAWAELPGGAVEPLLRIERWSFEWQDEYRYVEPVRLPAGARLRLEVEYDNSEANAANPSQPPRRVLWGPSSHDEMGDVWLQVSPAREEDRAVLEEAVRRHERERFREGYALRVAVDPTDAEAHARLGIGLVQEGFHAEALPHLETALAARPDAWDLNYNAGVAMAALGRQAEARARFESALRVDPDDARTHTALGGSLLAEGDLRGALAHYRRAVELRPASADLQSNLGLALQQAGDRTGAETSYREALRLQPAHAMATLNYSGLLSELGRDDEAIAALERLVEHHPDRFEAHVNLARSLARTGRFEDAERHLRRALERRPEGGEILYLLGLVLGRQGRFDEAIAALEAAVRHDPSNAVVREDLRQMRAVVRRRGESGF
jgi:Flp pilus assembly protein TadD